MYDFSDISFIIPIRVDTKNRIQNLNSLITLFTLKTVNPFFLIINDSSKPDTELLKPIFEKHKKYCKIFFLQNEKPFNRGLSFNTGVNLLNKLNINRSCIICGDTDVFIKPDYIFNGYSAIKQNKADCIFPNNGLFIDVKSTTRDVFLNELSFKNLEKNFSKKDVLKVFFNKGDFTVLHTAYRSGCVIFNKQSYEKFNGYNPNFWGWGYEDDELYLRMNKLGFILDNIKDDNAIAWHMSHPGTIKAENPFYQHNHDVCKSVENMNKEEVLNYISSWTI